jgi:peptidoglycan/xylan/chitin deacetylase (PgdA/CDA1 family)
LSALIRRRFNVISLDDLRAWLAGSAQLPRYPALITFDDGYADNFHHAYPVLAAHHVPAVIFLTTGYIERSIPFYWDFAAYCFAHTSTDSATLPVTGSQQWTTDQNRQTVLNEWLESLKKLPDVEKQRHLDALPALLNVSVPDETFAGMHLTWDQVREMVTNGITMGSHTMSHPILTRISLDEAELELRGSKQRIEEETGQKVTGLAYPNGGQSDFSTSIQHIAQKLGYDVAFTLLRGPTSRQEVRRDPMVIRRLFFGHRDTLPRFAAMISGFQRLTGFPR